MALLGKKDRADDGDSAASAKNVSNRLRTLEERGFTGAVEISVKGSNATAQIYFYEGGVYATHLGGYGPVVMDRLRTDGVVDASRWSELAQIFGAHQAHGRVGPTAVEQEWMTVDELVNLHQELLIACLGAVIAVPKARIDRETSATTSDYCSLPQDIPRLLRLVQGRQQRIARAWEAIEARCEPGELVLRAPEVVEQLPIGRGLLEWVELRAVQVLQERVPQHRVVLGVLDDRGDRGQSGDLRCAKSPLPHDELVCRSGVVASRRPADDHRLKDADLGDRVDQLGQLVLVEDGPGLARVRADRGDREFGEYRARNRGEVGTVGRVGQARGQVAGRGWVVRAV